MINLRLRLIKLFEIAPHLHRGVVPGDAPLMLSIHIPKTAGTSFRGFLRQIYGRRLHHDYGPDSVMTTGLIRDALRSEGEPPGVRLREAVERGRIGCVHGHFAVKPYLERFPDADWVCWLRHPVERIISLYNHHLRTYNPRNPGGLVVYGGRISLIDFAGLNRNRNAQARRLEQVGAGRFTFTGLVEYYDESIRRFIRRFDLPVEAARQPIRNRAPRALEVDEETQEAIAGLNRKDMDLYRQVRSTFDSER